MTPLFRKFLGLNWILLVNMIALIAWGVWAIYNASSFREGMNLSNVWRSQVQWAVLGMAVFGVASLIDYKWVRWGGWLLYITGIAGLILVKFIGFGEKGAHSKIHIGPVDLQPSQLAIVATIVSLAVVLGDLHRIAPVFRHHWLRLGVSGAMAGIPMLMVLKEPDLGSAAVYGPVVIAMLLVGSIPFRYLITLFLAVMCVLPVAYFFGLKPYQKKRVEVFVNMLTNKKVDTLGDAYMADKVKIAVGSAGFEGKGPLSVKVDGRSVHRTFFTPTEAINDFIYSVIVEEFGFRGGLLQIVVMALLLLQCVFVAFYARDNLGRLIVVGIVAMLFAHSMQNMGMNILMMPITGLPLPFTSYGGTFLIVCMFLMGLVQSVWIHRNISPVKQKSRRGEDGSDEEF
ncbi:MAG: FtsW/RodA/SpoVE family cell cycle protein [Verrucomicrobium sp.]|nr:FtsW/RodA/SpoVE family cell cycle protein [Verrucomicrobium sp.]